MRRCLGIAFVLCLTAVFMMSGAAIARDYKITVDGQDVYFDLDKTQIAVRFAPTTGMAEQSALLESMPGIGIPALKQVEEPLHMSLINLKANASETELLTALTALEASASVEWSAPVLIFDREQHIPTRDLYIQFDKTVGQSEAETLLDKYGLTLLKRCDDWAENTVYVKRSKGTGVESLDLCDALSDESGVVWAEPDFIRTVRFATNDTYYSSQWYLNQTGDHDIDAPEAWNVTTGSTSIIISICDVGVQIAHPDLNDHIETGYDAVDGDSDPTPATSYQGDSHGTCCAGIAAAETNNSTGVAGVGYNCHLMGTRMGYIISGSSIYTNNTWIVNCINYSRDNAHVMSNSWGGGSTSSTVNTALATAKAAGLTILFASGNDNTSVQWPATQSTVIAVGATNESDYRCDPGDWGSGQGSNYGSSLDVVAPGNNQYATDDSRTGAGYSTGSYYAYFGGTSGACPVAAGVCALILSANPSLTPDEVQTILQNTAQDLVGDPAEDVAGFDIYMGWGRVNAYQAVMAAGGLVVTSPNGGEVWYTNESHNITWTSSGVSGNVKIELNRTYPSGTWETLFASITNDGLQAWTVAGTVSAQARIRISSVTNPAVYDDSDADFTIAAPFTEVTAPNGGETWYTGASEDITWNSGGFTGNVKIELNRSYSGGAWETLYASTANDGIESWTVSGTSTTSAARIRVSSATTPTINDVSDANFTISLPIITIVVPNGGETWHIGNSYFVQWQTTGLTGNVKIELNRTYPAGTWETLYSSTVNDGYQEWYVTSPTSAQARVRISSVDQPAALDVSDANFTIAGQPPVLYHDPLDDFAPGMGIITAVSSSQQALTVITVKMFYRPAGGGAFDSLQLVSTANPDEYWADLSSFAEGSYEYYVRATDDVGFVTTVPADAPTALYTFDVADICASELAYDDGSAEYFSWSEGNDGINFQWAVKFGPVLYPYVLCGTRFAASRSLPDTVHSLVHIYVYDASGAGGTPGSLLQDVVTGSIGNDIGGVPAGTNWAQVNLTDDLGDALVINSSEFFIAVSNIDVGKYEAFGRDTSGTLNHRSYFYDPCEAQWFSEDDTGTSDNAYPGNRLIRAQGYSLVSPPEVVIGLNGTDIVLYWTNVGAPLYNVYSAPAAGGPYTLFTSTTFTTVVVEGTGTSDFLKFYQVKAASE